jgi:hypothetical protein
MTTASTSPAATASPSRAASPNLPAPRDLTRVRLLLGLIAAEQAAMLLVWVPTLTAGRAVAASVGLALGVVASMLAFWLLGRGRGWPLVLGRFGAAAAITQAFLMHGAVPEAAFWLLCGAVVLASGPLLDSDLWEWGKTAGPSHRWALVLLIPMIVAGFALPTAANSTGDPTQVGPDSLKLSIGCQMDRTPDYVIVTARVEFHWLGVDLLPDGLAGAAGARDWIAVWANQSDLLQAWLGEANTYPPDRYTGGGMIHHSDFGQSPWSSLAGPVNLSIDGRPATRPFASAPDWNWSSSSGLPQTDAKVLEIRWDTIEVGRTYAATWSFRADPDTAPAFMEVQYNHLDRMTFQNGADCSRPAVAYPTRYLVNVGSY